MTPLLWLALVLVGLWIVVKLVFKVVGGFVHVLLLLALVALVFGFLR
ncbi:MAG: hypothetical protein JWL95_1513 [Gemmatimonadetes bacterium]|nr:hypothetical protein [Gemmatimonadota bacterium]